MESPLGKLLELTLTIIQQGRRWRHYLTPLFTLLRRMPMLLDFPEDIYTGLCVDFRKPPPT